MLTGGTARECLTERLTMSNFWENIAASRGTSGFLSSFPEVTSNMATGWDI